MSGFNKGNCLYRKYGEDEFCILLPNKCLNDARDVALRIMEPIEIQTHGADLAGDMTVILELAEFQKDMVFK